MNPSRYLLWTLVGCLIAVGAGLGVVSATNQAQVLACSGLLIVATLMSVGFSLAALRERASEGRQ